MSIGAVIVARMASRRLPGKMLRDLAGRPLMERVFARALRLTSVHELVLATSDNESDDELVAHCRSIGLPVFRGSERDVARRLLACAEQHGCADHATIGRARPGGCHL